MLWFKIHLHERRRGKKLSVKATTIGNRATTSSLYYFLFSNNNNEKIKIKKKNFKCKKKKDNNNRNKWWKFVFYLFAETRENMWKKIVYYLKFHLVTVFFYIDFIVRFVSSLFVEFQFELKFDQFFDCIVLICLCRFGIYNHFVRFLYQWTLHSNFIGTILVWSFFLLCFCV